MMSSDPEKKFKGTISSFFLSRKRGKNPNL